MEIRLERKIFNKDSCEGSLYVEDKWYCYTIEDKVRAPIGMWLAKYKVYAKTAIPYGRYPVLVTWSNRFKRLLTGVFGVPDFSGIRIHNGVNELSSAGCIIVSYTRNAITHSLSNDRAAMNDLSDLVYLAQKNQKIWLTIVNTQV